MPCCKRSGCFIWSFLVDCQWASWGSYSSCGSSCGARDGSGEQTRSRTSTAAMNGGTACVGADGSDTLMCFNVCPSKQRWSIHWITSGTGWLWCHYMSKHLDYILFILIVNSFSWLCNGHLGELVSLWHFLQRSWRYRLPNTNKESNITRG